MNIENILFLCHAVVGLNMCVTFTIEQQRTRCVCV